MWGLQEFMGDRVEWLPKWCWKSCTTRVGNGARAGTGEHGHIPVHSRVKGAQVSKWSLVVKLLLRYPNVAKDMDTF